MSKPDLSSPDGFISALSDLGPMRVWSVIITIFGDLVRPRGGVVSAAALNAIGARLGIRPEAMRVALFRLVKDGWIERRKEGRNSFYVLTQNGSRKFLPATQRIYAHSPALRGPWTLVSFDSAPQADVTQKLEEDGFFAISSQIYLGSVGSGLEPDTALIMAGEVRIFPAWAKAKLGPDELAAEFRKLNHRLQQLEQGWALARASALDAVCLRVLMIHQWRRLLLRHPDVPLEMMPDGWPGEDCRNCVLRLHAQLSQPAEPWLIDMIGAEQT